MLRFSIQPNREDAQHQAAVHGLKAEKLYLRPGSLSSALFPVAAHVPPLPHRPCRQRPPSTKDELASRHSITPSRMASTGVGHAMANRLGGFVALITLPWTQGESRILGSPARQSSFVATSLKTTSSSREPFVIGATPKATFKPRNDAAAGRTVAAAAFPNQERPELECRREDRDRQFAGTSASQEITPIALRYSSLLVASNSPIKLF